MSFLMPYQAASTTLILHTIACNHPSSRLHSKAFVSPLSLATEAERALFEEGETNKTKREQERKQSLMKQPPSDAESLNIHQLFLKTLDEK